MNVRIAHVGASARGEELVRPLRQVAEPVVDTVATMPYTEVDRIHDEPTEPMPLEHRTMALASLDDGAVDTLLELIGPDVESPILAVELRHLGGALARPPAVPSAVCNRDAGFSLLAATYTTPETKPHIVERMEDLMGAMTPWATGGRLLNFLTGPDTADDVEDAFDPDVFRRLAAVKAVHDPDNLFRVNHNIAPAP